MRTSLTHHIDGVLRARVAPEIHNQRVAFFLGEAAPGLDFVAISPLTSPLFIIHQEHAAATAANLRALADQLDRIAAEAKAPTSEPTDAVLAGGAP